MARDPFLLDSTLPSAIAPATPTIAHVQLRDLLICPREQGVLNYVIPHAIVEQDINSPNAPIRVVSHLGFTPISLTSLQIGNGTLIAAGGQETEIHLSYHTPAASSASSERRSGSCVQWEFEGTLTGSINNSVLLTSLSLTRSNESSIEPRVGISNNDGSVKLYDIPLRVQSARRRLREVGQIRLEVPVNHSSISPDGRTLLSVGDSSKIYFHQITGGGSISFQPITTLNIPPPDTSSSFYSSSSHGPYSPSSYTSLAAAFSTAFSGDGSKFAVASQEGVVAVWDVRSTKPMRVFHTNKMRGVGSGNGSGNGGASGWLSDDPWEWTRGTKAPGWCVRSVKFNSGEGGRLGREVMAFTEHTSLIHVVDARTFETHDTVRVPALPPVGGQVHNPPRREPSSNHTSVRHLATRFREARRMAEVSTDELLQALEDGEHLRSGTASNASSSGTADANNNTGAMTGSSLVRRLLPVSNARQTRHSPTPQGTTHRFGTTRRAGARSAPAGTTVTPTASAPATDTPAGISARLSPESASNLMLSAWARGLPAHETIAAMGDYTTGSSGTAYRSTSTAAASTSPRGVGTGTPAIVQALGDAFRIPLPASVPSGNGGGYSAPASIGDSTWRTLSGTHAVGAGSLARVGSGGSSTGGGLRGPMSPPGRFRDYGRDEGWSNRDQEGGGHSDEFGEGIVVVPDLGDRDVESEVHALLAVHGIESRLGSQAGGSGNGWGDGVARTVSADTETSAGAQTVQEFETYMRTLNGALSESEGGGEGDDVDADENVEDDEDDNGHDGADGEDYHAWFLRALGSLDNGSVAFDDAIGAAHRMYADEEAGRRARAEVSGGGAYADMDEDDEDDEDEDRMIVDEDDNDERLDEREDGYGHENEFNDLDFEYFECASRSGSPFAGSYHPHTSTHTFPSSSATSAPWSARRYGSYAWPPSHIPPTRKAGCVTGASAGAYRYFEDLDIAGLCFDPWGEKMYAAGVGSGKEFYFGSSGAGGAGDESHGAGAVVEWSVRGADKRWWVDDGWM